MKLFSKKNLLLIFFVLMPFVLVGCMESNQSSFLGINGYEYEENDGNITINVGNHIDSINFKETIRVSEQASFEVFLDKDYNFSTSQSIVDQGENIFYLLVTAEDKETSNEYKIIINREITYSINYQKSDDFNFIPHNGSKLVKQVTPKTNVFFGVDINLDHYHVKANGEILEQNENNLFQIQVIDQDIDISVEPFVLVEDLESIEGYDLIYKDSPFAKKHVSLNSDFTFKLDLKDGYEKENDFSLFVNGNKILADEFGYYHLDNVDERKQISVEGISPVYFEISFNVEKGEKIDPIEMPFKDEVNLPNAKKEGHKFKGWFLDEKFLEPFNYDKMPAKHLEVYALWEVKSYTITFDTRGGDNLDEITKDYGSPVALIDIIPTKEGYKFDGWHKDSDLTNKATFTTMPAKNLTLYASWIAD